MTTVSASTLIKSIPCFEGLGPQFTERLIRSIREQTYPPNEIVILEGEPCPGLFIVKSGSVKLYRSSNKGEEQIVRLLHRGGCFECVPFFDGGNNPISAQAMDETTLYFVPADDFMWILANSPNAIRAFTPILARRLRSLVSTVGDLAHRRVYPRLARLLSQLSEEKDGKIVVSPYMALHQQHLACMLGCSRQIVNSSMRKLVKEGIIRREDRHIIIVNPERLDEIS